MLKLALRLGRHAWVQSVGRNVRFRRLVEFVEDQLRDRPLPVAIAAPVERVSGTSLPLRGVPVSIVVNTVDRADLLERLLTSLENLRYRPFEVVVVAGPCRDHTGEVLDRWAGRIKRRACPDRNLSQSRNIGLQAASGDIVAFIDDDAVPEPDWLDRLIEPLTNPCVGAVGGPIRDWTGVRFQCRALTSDRLAQTRPIADAEAETFVAGGRLLTLTGTNFCLRRDAALAIGGFDEDFPYFLEETDIQRRLASAGFRLAFVSDAEVHHGFAASAIRDASRLPTDFGVVMSSLVYFCRKHAAERTTDADIAHRVAQKLNQVRVRLDRLVLRNAIEESRANALWRTALAGVKRGSRIAGQSAPRRLETEGEPFLAFSRQRPAGPPVLRLALVGAAGHVGHLARGLEALADALGRQGHEVTLVLPRSRRHTAEFLRHHWNHRVPLDGLRERGDSPRSPWAHKEVWTELDRVAARRDFEHVVSVAEQRKGIRLRVHAYKAAERNGTPADGADIIAEVGPVTLEDLASQSTAITEACHGHLGQGRRIVAMVDRDEGRLLRWPFRSEAR